MPDYYAISHHVHLSRADRRRLAVGDEIYAGGHTVTVGVSERGDTDEPADERYHLYRLTGGGNRDGGIDPTDTGYTVRVPNCVAWKAADVADGGCGRLTWTEYGAIDGRQAIHQVVIGSLEELESQLFFQDSQTGRK